jgi:hypothetical protein
MICLPCHHLHKCKQPINMPLRFEIRIFAMLQVTSNQGDGFQH